MKDKYYLQATLFKDVIWIVIDTTVNDYSESGLTKMVTGKSIDDVLVNFSLFGPYYIQFVIIVFLILLTNSMYWTNYVFVVEEVGYW